MKVKKSATVARTSLVDCPGAMVIVSSYIKYMLD